MIAEAVEKLRKAMVDTDRETLKNLTAEELSYGHASGLIEDKEHFVHAIGSRDFFKKIELSDQIIQSEGDIAIVRHRFQAEVTINGNFVTPDVRVLQVWKNKEGEWKLVARQAFK